MAVGKTRTCDCIVICCFRVVAFLVSCAATQDSTPMPVVENQPMAVNVDLGAIESLEASDDFKELPGVQHEFRIEVGAGTSQCFYQRLPANAQLHISFQVIRGIDRNIEFMITGPHDMVLEHLEWTADAGIQKTIPMEGLYRLCLKNEKSQFTPKLLYFYMIMYIEEKWHQHSKNILEFFDEASDIEKSLDLVNEQMKKIHLEQANSRRYVITDWYLIQDNNSYIQSLSLVLCIIIVATSAFQVFFVRRLFNTRNVTPKSKPRA